MGKGDKKTKRGKIVNGSYGRNRRRKTLKKKNITKAVVVKEPKATALVPVEEKPGKKKTPVKKTATKPKKTTAKASAKKTESKAVKKPTVKKTTSKKEPKAKKKDKDQE